ncbi:dTDP-4-dehydrorhamnose reductase [Paenibacillus sp. EPM92]|uniref:dTDP-4-dehydrorhamnose reductase n=1 Tax=Paenibacillus sp. EPM92 TaxID=1561195 RepID=UPI001916561F|nr:dTDP-4-dehydrorhamnose reductase [Paenibacillus sp. EPM92]
MRILITGANGQLGKDLDIQLKDQHEVYALGRRELDVTFEDQCKSRILEIQPDVIVHCAAYTAVDLAETDEDTAYKVNVFGTRNLAVAAEEVGAKFCYLSTDYVFDGTASTPYKEYDHTNPQSVYGKTKRAGEHVTQTLSSKYFIVRTSWVYGREGSNFVKTMLKLAKEQGTLKVVADQIGSPTYTVDLARFLSELIVTDRYGIYHASNKGICSWYEFACAIFEESGISVKVEPCSTEEFLRPAPRPKYSVMDHLSIRANGFQDLPHWREALRDFLRELSEENK